MLVRACHVAHHWLSVPWGGANRRATRTSTIYSVGNSHSMPAEIIALDDAPPLDLRQQALLAFVEAGGVAAAAEALALPQPTISRRLQIFQRRDAAGETILVRQGRNLRLSEKGHAALPAIRELVSQYEQFSQFLKGARAAVQVIRIGTGQFGAQHYLPRALSELHRRKIDCEVRAESVRGRDRILGVVEGRFDLALVTHDPRQIQMIVSGSSNRRAKFVVEPLATHEFCVLAPRLGSPLASERCAQPAALAASAARIAVACRVRRSRPAIGDPPAARS